MSAEGLPLECLQFIISHVYNSNDSHTLFNLLQVSKHICSVTLPILYVEPFRRELHVNRPNAKTSLSIIKLVKLLLSCANPETLTELLCYAYSESDEPNIPVKPRSGINYLHYLRFFQSLELDYQSFLIFQNDFIKEKLSKTDFLNHLGYAPKYLGQELDLENNYYGVNQTFSQYLSVDLRVQLTWALCSDNLENIRALAIPLSDIHRYISVIDRLKNLTFVTFLLDKKLDYSSFYLQHYQEVNPEGLEAKRKEKVKALDAMIEFITAHLTLFPGRLECFSCPDNEVWSGNLQSCPISYQTQLQNLLPVLNRPRIIDEKTWFQFLMHIDNIDLSQLEVIELPVSDPVRYFPASQAIKQSQFLQRCRSLRRLQMISFGPNFFEWAMKEKRQWENRSSAGPGSKPSPLVKLKHACLWGHWEPVKSEVNDILAGFSDTIETLVVRDVHRLPSNLFMQTPAPNFVDISLSFPDLPLELPKLKKLIISLPRQEVYLPRYFIGACPELTHLEIQDKAPMYRSHDLRLGPNRRILDINQPHPLSYKFIKLQGIPALYFRPKYLHRMPDLEVLILEATHPIGHVPTSEEIIQSEYSSTEEEEEDLLIYSQKLADGDEVAISDLESTMLLKRPYWSWDWELLKLKSLYFSGEFAWRFKFKMLARCPNLESLTLVSSSSSGNPSEVRKDGHVLPAVNPSFYMYRKMITAQDFLKPNELYKSPESNAKSKEKTKLEYIQLPKLTYVFFCGSVSFTDEALEVMLKDVFPNIKTFNTTHCGGFTVQGWFNAMEQSTSLEKCSLSVHLSREWQQLMEIEQYQRDYVGSVSEYSVIEEIKDGISQPTFIRNPDFVNLDPKPIYELRGVSFVKKKLTSKNLPIRLSTDPVHSSGTSKSTSTKFTATTKDLAKNLDEKLSINYK